MRRLKVGTPVEVVWKDTLSRLLEEPGDLSEYEAGYINRDLGYYVGMKDDCIVLALEKGEDEDGYRGTTDIPIGTVQEIHVMQRRNWYPRRRKNAKQKRVARENAGDSGREN